jgi:hypothetical protein
VEGVIWVWGKKHRHPTTWASAMSPNGTRFERDHAYKEAFLALLSRAIASPSPEWPTLRCWTKTSLDRLFKGVKADLEKRKQPQSNLELLNWMHGLGLAWTINAEGATFYLLEMGASPRSEIDPLELMMAYEPGGVICYFSAIAYHSLTSQVPSHHHVAVLIPSSKIRESNQQGHDEPGEALRQEPIAKKLDDDTKTRSTANPFGKVLFSYADIPYHLTRRAKRLVPGVQIRSFGPRGRFRITSYEQTLLDTLHRPQNCGGPAVALEAWQNASDSGRLDEERLLTYLTQMEYSSTTRRLGAMLQLMNYTPGGELKSYLERAKGELNRQAPYSQISLLPGFDYSNLNSEWLVNSP